MMPPRPTPLLDDEAQSRFWSRVEKGEPNECWNWTGYTVGAGYGVMRVHGKQYLVHRLSYVLHGGTIPSGDTVDHLCFNKVCVNPAHLDTCSLRENQRRAWAIQYWTHYNTKKTHCKRGHEFTPENTRELKGGRRCCRTCVNERQRARRKSAVA